MPASGRTAADGGWSLEARDPETIQTWLPVWEWLYRYYFRVQTDGWEQIPSDETVLFVGSHNGGIASPDLPMFMVDWFRRFGLEIPIYGLMHPKVWQVSPQMGALASRLGAVQAHPKMAVAALQQQASVLVYPGGARDVFRPHRLRDRIHLAEHTGFIKLALRQEVPIVPIVSWGAHDTLVILDDCYEQAKFLNERGLMPWLFGIDPEVFPVYLGLPWGFAFGPLPNLPLPVQIHTRVCQPIAFPRYGLQAARDRDYVAECYAIVVRHMQLALDSLVSQYSA
ncbi:lysophospholipid acyltransferase family protein [Synechococcus sp. PCC 7336]|uniref:lysophospholipid acyltransferase family protein n=1 Tax=Synechococcus sp. PCC 7336 TaxID=195250 RepID=UPI00034506F5|nr:lysophospholipid acyltransferase family protein [Synechococcus sp. PCC 7336]